MLLYFPSIKIIKCDVVPSHVGANYLFYFKSTSNSPKHYPAHPLIDGKIEFVGKFHQYDELKYWFKYCLNEDNHKNLKGKIVSVLLDFNPDKEIKFSLVGLGKKDNDAYYLFNRNMTISPEEAVAKLNYELNPQKGKEKKRIKV